MSPSRVAILGGSFDPIHAAHLEMARRCRIQIPVDEVWFLPADRPPHKMERHLTASRHRLAMLELALEGEKAFRICTLEIDRGGVQYTLDTISQLQLLHPGLHFHLVIGEDNFEIIELWHQPAALLDRVELVVQARPGSTGARTNRILEKDVLWLEGPELDLSSTGVRRLLAEGKDPDGLNPRVLDYIREHELYRHGDFPQ